MRSFAKEMRRGHAAQPFAINRDGHAAHPDVSLPQTKFYSSIELSVHRPRRPRAAYERPRRAFGTLTTPSIASRANSALIRLTFTFSFRCQLATALHMPRMASVATRGSR